MSTQTALAGRYELGELLGTGGVASVYRARDLLLGREVAVKVFGPGIDPSGPERERAEMRTLAGLSHPHLVTLYDAGTDTAEHPPRAYLVMALIDGPSLAECLRTGPMAPDRLRSIGRDVAAALTYVHSRGVVHRDIKPANILLDQSGDPSGKAYLADFGVAQEIGSSALTEVGHTVGTAAYLSPEQVQGHDVSGPADVYAFGLVLLEALTGEREFPGTTTEAALARLSRSPRVAGRVPAPWEDLLTRATATDPALRPTAQELTTALSGTATDRTQVMSTGGTRLLTTAVPLVTAPLAKTPRRRPRWPLLVAAALVLLVLGAVALASSGGSTSVPKPPPGSPGPSRLGPDLARLRQLVQP